MVQAIRLALVAVVLGVSNQALGADTSLRGEKIEHDSSSLFESSVDALTRSSGPTAVTTFRASSTSDDVAAAIEAFNKHLNEVSNNNQVAINWDGGAVTAITQGKTAALPGDLFLANRQVLYKNLACTEDGFETLHMRRNHFNTDNVTPFSPNVTCGPSFEISKRFTDVSFTLADLKTPGKVFGFGTVFNVPDGNPRNAGLTFFQGLKEVARVDVVEGFTTKKGAQVFVGVIFDEPIISSVKIDYGFGGNLAQFSAPADNWFFDLAQNK